MSLPQDIYIACCQKSNVAVPHAESNTSVGATCAAPMGGGGCAVYPHPNAGNPAELPPRIYDPRLDTSFNTAVAFRFPKSSGETRARGRDVDRSAVIFSVMLPNQVIFGNLQSLVFANKPTTHAEQELLYGVSRIYEAYCGVSQGACDCKQSALGRINRVPS